MRDVDTHRLVQSIMELSDEYGPIFQLHTPGGVTYVVSGLDMVQDLCDDSRFDKLVGTGQREIRKTHMSAGLFTADTVDPLWKSAHDILLPSFSTWAMKGYVEPMVDIAEQMMLKWERLNPDEPIDVAGDMTRLTLDTIALCGFGYRFNSFYRDSQHPFVEAMMESLSESLKRQQMLPVQVKLRRGAQRRFLANAKYMDDTIDTIVKERRASGEPGNDLLGHMLVGTDKQGNTLPDHNIVAQCGTFLIAGHETTSGLLSFAIALPAQAPRGRGPGAGGGRPRAGHRPGRVADRRPDQPARLRPADPRRDPAALAHRARVHPPGEEPGRDRRRVRPVRPGDRDRRTDPDAAPPAGGLGLRRREFNPDHMSEERRDALPPNAYRPFGSGQRACIGRQFALQEATLVLGMVLQRFELIDHANYQLKIKETLTVKPEGLTITVRPREGRTWGSTVRPAVSVPEPRSASLPVAPVDRHGTPAARAVRLQPRRRRGPRHPHRPRRGRPRLHRAHRRARRGRRRAAERGRRGRRDVVVQRGAAGQRGEVLRLAGRLGVLGHGREVHGLRVRQPRLGRDVPGRADARRPRTRGPRRHPRVPARRG